MGVSHGPHVGSYSQHSFIFSPVNKAIGQGRRLLKSEKVSDSLKKDMFAVGEDTAGL